MISSKFEVSIFCGLMVGWGQLMNGYTAHAFYSMGIMVTIILMGILGYLKEIYMRPK